MPDANGRERTRLWVRCWVRGEWIRLWAQAVPSASFSLSQSLLFARSKQRGIVLRVPTFQLIQEPRLESRLLGESVGTCDVHAERLRLDYESDSAKSNVAAQTETELGGGRISQECNSTANRLGVAVNAFLKAVFLNSAACCQVADIEFPAVRTQLACNQPSGVSFMHT